MYKIIRVLGGKKKQRKGKEKREPENRSLRLRMLLTEALNQRHSEKVPSDEDLESAINTRESEEREGPVWRKWDRVATVMAGKDKGNNGKYYSTASTLPLKTFLIYVIFFLSKTYFFFSLPETRGCIC